MRAVWQRINEQKQPVEKQKGYAAVVAKPTSTHKTNSEYLLNTNKRISKTETAEERTVTPEEIRPTQEEKAKTHTPQPQQKTGQLPHGRKP